MKVLVSILFMGMTVFLGCRADSNQEGAEGQFLDKIFSDANDKYVYAVAASTVYFLNESQMQQNLTNQMETKTRIFIVANKDGAQASATKSCAGGSSNAYGRRLIALPEGFYSKSHNGVCYVRVSPVGNYDSERFLWVPSDRIEEVGTVE